MPEITQETSHRDNEAALRYAKDLLAAKDVTHAQDLLRHAITESVTPDHIHIFLFDPENAAYTANISNEWGNNIRLSEPQDSIIPQTLKNSPEFYIVDQAIKAAHSNTTQNHLEDPYKSQLLIPLTGNAGMIGWIALGAKKNQTPYSTEELELLTFYSRQYSILYEIKNSLDSLQKSLHNLELLQQIDRELNETRDLDLALQVTLRAALAHTQTEAGSIGLVDENFEAMENFWSIGPKNQTPILIDEAASDSLLSFIKENIEKGVSKSSELTASLNIAEEYPWHIQMVSEITEDQYLVYVFHLTSPEMLHETDIQFLERLKDQAAIAIKNVLLYKDLNDAIQTKNEFIGFISHELKNPLTVIKGYADILIRGMAGSINEEQRDYLITITHNVRRLNTFITDLSDQSHIETKSLRLTFESTPVRELVNDVLQSYAGQIKKQNLRVITQLNEPIPNVWCDRLRVIQILSNLVSNAIKYTPEAGCVTLGAEHTQNDWDKKGAAEVVHFWVEDSGYGISPEDQTHMFEKFYRGTDDRIRKIPGTGLGLRIAKSLTEMMGGKMWFTSVKGEGSIFHFTIPI